MKRKLVMLLTTAAMLFAVACGSDNNGNGGNESAAGTPPATQAPAETNGNGNAEATPPATQAPAETNGYTEPPATPGDENAPPAAENSPGAAVSAFFGYLASGNVLAADALMLHSNGDFAAMAEEMFDELGVSIFQNISYSDLEYTINGNNASATFTITNVDLAATAEEAGYWVGMAMIEDLIEFGYIDFSHLDINDPNFELELEAIIEDFIASDFEIQMLILEWSFELIADMIMENDAVMFSLPVSINLNLVDGNWILVDDNMPFAMALLGTW